jgi:hypothetical protein
MAIVKEVMSHPVLVGGDEGVQVRAVISVCTSGIRELKQATAKQVVRPLPSDLHGASGRCLTAAAELLDILWPVLDAE